MIFSVIILLILVGVTYYHYVQGMFTAAVSAFCAFIAVLAAFGYYEQIVGAAGQGAMADYAAGMVMLVVFAATYILLRLIVDSAVPGNILVPLYVEKGGAAVFGLITGVLVAGTFASAAQLMPFGPAIAGYERFATGDREQIQIPNILLGGTQDKDGYVQSVLKNENLTLNPDENLSMMAPVDDFVVSLASLASENAFRGNASLSEVHPNLLDEAFAARLGAEQGGMRVIVNKTGVPNVTVTDLFTVSGTVDAADAEHPALRPNKASLTYKPSSGETILVVRAQFTNATQDSDGVVRITPAAIRLVTGGKTYRPIGTMISANKIALQRVDDQILVTGGQSADFAFALPKAVADGFTKAQPKGGAARDMGFIEFKLFGRTDFAGKVAGAYTGPSDKVSVVRKPASPAVAGAPAAKPAK